MSKDCGICGFHPKWLRNRATLKIFIAVYSLLGTVQAMAFVYIIVTLTTLEKRYKIPSRTTGIILSGNEISEVLSLILIFYGGSGHRPKWIAVGVGLSALSCIVLALPHFMYGPGRDALALTKEYLDQDFLNMTIVTEDLAICPRTDKPVQCDAEALLSGSLLPRLLIFISQFILGIGTTLYYALGQTYLDDNTKKKNTPMLLGFTLAVRTVGPVIGFLLGFFCLRLYIDPTLHPVIAQNDPRWLGAWWLGWIILGVTMGIFAVLMALFPRDLPTVQDTPKTEGEVPLKLDLSSQEKCTLELNKPASPETEYTPTIREFPQAMKRILSNKLLTCNNLSAVFYILGASAYITFSMKYLEVQYNVSASTGAMIAGPVTLIGMILGFLLSGVIISKYKPSPRPLLGWNVFVGICFILGQVCFTFLGCTDSGIRGIDLKTMQINLTADCSADCNCAGVKYSPVCHEASKTTFFSACHAGCRTVLDNKQFGNCSCLPLKSEPSYIGEPFEYSISSGSLISEQHMYLSSVRASLPFYDKVQSGPCRNDCNFPYLMFTIINCVIQMLACSGRIGNILVNYRSVEKRDKSFAQGVTLMIVSLLSLIPGPIIYGAIIDSTCLVWEESCGTRGNCWFYHRDNFRYFVNVSSAGFFVIAVIFDIIVCYLGKDLDLYGAEEADKRREFVKEDVATDKQEENADKKKEKVHGDLNQQDSRL